MAKEKKRVAGNKLVDHVSQLVARGDVRRVCLLDEEKSLLEIPVSLGDPAAPPSVLKAPVLAAIRAFGTLVNECTVEAESTDKEL